MKKTIQTTLYSIVIAVSGFSNLNAQAPTNWTNTAPSSCACYYGGRYNAEDHQANDILFLSDGSAICSGVAYTNPYMWDDWAYHYGIIQKYDLNGNVIKTYYGPGSPNLYGGKEYGKILKIVSNKNDAVYAIAWQKAMSPNYNFRDTFSLLKLNQNLKLLWSIELPKYSQYKLEIDDNGNPLIAFAKQGKVVVIKYSGNNGSVIWTGQITATKTDLIGELNDLKIDKFNNAYICGSAYSSILGHRYLTAKVNSNGTMAWKKFYDGQNALTDDVAKALVIDNNQNVIVTGVSFYNGTNTDFLTLKYDANGNIIWYKRKDLENRKNGGQFIEIDALNNFYVAGFDGDTGAVLFKYNENGNLLWQDKFSNFTVNAISVAAQGDCFMAGHKLFHGSTIESADKAHLKKILTNGDVDWIYTDNKDLSVPIIWYPEYEEVRYGTNFLVVDFNEINHKLVAAGHKLFDYYNSGSHQTYADWYTVAFSSTARKGNLSADYNTDFNLYPNPVSNQLTLQLKDEITESQLAIIDLQGREVLTRNLFSNNETIDVTLLKPGIYFVRITYDDQVLNKKFVKE
jgi:hypothetical protein